MNAFRCLLRHFLARERGTMDTDQWNLPPPSDSIPCSGRLASREVGVPLFAWDALGSHASFSFPCVDPSAPTRVHWIKCM